MIRKKEYTYIYKTIYGKIVFTLPQVCAEESLEFYDILEKKDEIEVLRYIKLILNKYGKIEVYGNLFTRHFNKKHLLNTFFHNSIDFLVILTKLIHKVHISKYDGINIIIGKERPSNYGSNMLILSEKTGIPVDKLLYRLSLEELGIYKDAIMHSNLEQSEKTQKYNDQAEENKKSKLTREEKRQAMRKFREDLKNKQRKTIYVGTIKGQ